MQQYRPNKFGLLPPVVKNLLIINGLLFLATITLQKVFNFDLIDFLGLHFFKADKFKGIQYITYMFLHGSFGHVFFNMFALWMFGNVLENVWGGRRFLFYVLFTGIGAALLHTLVIYIELRPFLHYMNAFLNDPTVTNMENFLSHHRFTINPHDIDIIAAFNSFKEYGNSWLTNPSDLITKAKVIEFMGTYKEYVLNLPTVVGASGAVFGILLAFGMLFPNSLIYIYFAIPIKAKYFVMIYGALELYLGFSNRMGDNIAHFAHLGGMLFGFILLMIWKKSRKKFY